MVGRHVNIMGGNTSTFRVLVGTPEGKKRLENLDVYIYIYDNIKMGRKV